MIPKGILALLLCIFSGASLMASTHQSYELTTINYRDAVHFKIPEHWLTNDEPGVQGTFYEDREDSGTLRVSVFEYRSDSENECNEKIKRALFPGNVETLTQGVYLKTEVSVGFEEGEKLALYRWLVALALPDNLFRLIIFTHTILEGQEIEPEIRYELDMLNQSIREAEYSYSTDLKMVDKL